MPISSPKNPFLQEIRKAAVTGRTTGEGLIVAEGPHLLEEAIKSEWLVEHVLVTDDVRERFARLLGDVPGELTEVAPRALAAASATESDQGVIALLRPRAWTWDDLRRGDGPVLVLDGVQDPGNAGTIIRSAEAFGASGVIFLRGSVRVANGKLLRVAAGSAFRIPILESVLNSELIQRATDWEVPLYALAAGGSQSILETDLSARPVLVLGSEGSGVSPVLAERARAIGIPMQAVESLNVGIAASITLFEAARQRGAR